MFSHKKCFLTGYPKKWPIRNSQYVIHHSLCSFHKCHSLKILFSSIRSMLSLMPWFSECDNQATIFLPNSMNASAMQSNLFHLVIDLSRSTGLLSLLFIVGCKWDTIDSIIRSNHILSEVRIESSIQSSPKRCRRKLHRMWISPQQNQNWVSCKKSKRTFYVYHELLLRPRSGIPLPGCFVHYQDHFCLWTCNLKYDCIFFSEDT